MDASGYPVQMYHPQTYPQQQQQPQQQAHMNYGAPPQNMGYMPNQQNIQFQSPNHVQYQRPPPQPHPSMSHPGMMYNNPAVAAAAMMSPQGMQQGMRPMSSANAAAAAAANPQFMNTFSRSTNGYAMPAAAPMPMNAYPPQQQQHIQMQQQQQPPQQQPQRQQFMQQAQTMPQQQQPMARPQQQPPFRQTPQQQQFLHHQQQQQPPQPQKAAATPSRPKRSTRTTKKKVTYDESSDEEDDLAFLDEESEQSDESEFEDESVNYKKKGKKGGAQATNATIEPDEVVIIPIGTKVFEKILDYRHHSETGEDQLMVKYKNMSFHHVEWVPLERIQGEHLGKHRVKKFLQKWNQDGQRGEDFRDHLKVDRVIDEGELQDPTTGENKIFFLVKWNGLFYDASTWESEEDLRKIDVEKIDEFHARRQIPQQKLADSPQRPTPMVTPFQHYEKSPEYKYGNELRSYQLEGLNWLRFCYYNYRSCILADEMGLGKTVQSVALLNDIYFNLGIRGPFLIIAPLSTVPHWIRAINAWTDLNVIDFRGSNQARSLIVETEFYYKDMQGLTIPNRYKFDVIVTTYEMASAGASLLREVQWKAGVFDEAHRLKNKQSKVGEILKTFYIEHKLLLTGTPLQNNLDELYSLLNFMQPEVFNDERLFFQEFGSLQSAAQVERLQALLKPIMLRRFKEDVEKTIPVKEETVIEVELTNPQKKWYRAILEKNFSFLKKNAKTNKEMPHLRNIMMQLRKCCIHPYLLEGAEEVILSECHATGPREQFNCLVQSSGKLVLIDKLLKKLIKGNHKVLIFSQFTSCLDILADYLRGRSYAYERIDGSVPGDQRQAAIDRFTTLPIQESFVFLLCTRAGGVGINLTAADTCIIFDSDWNPQNDLQAQARCHRIGQTKPVQIYRLICRNTYEKDMFDRAGIKLGLDKAVMQRSGPTSSDDNGSSGKSELTKKEIEDLLKKGAYGAMLDDEASTQFCEEDIDQILERRTTVIKHEGNEKGSIFSKATFSAAEDNLGVEIDDPDFWEKWAAKANIDATEEVDENNLIVYEPRRRRAVQRFGSRPIDGSYSSNDNAEDSDAYEEEHEKSRKKDQTRPWSLSEKTKYERKLMIYGYGRWDLMKPHFPRRTEKDLKSVTRALMRKVVPIIERNNEEDRKLVEDINQILESDCREEVRGDRSVPYSSATKKQITEFRSFLIQAPAEYVEHIERKGRNFLLRIQMLYLIRDKIVPNKWEDAKVLSIPKVTGSSPAPWWGDDEDRDLLLGICKHGYQQYLAMRNDKEFCFYGRKYDDSRAGSLEDEDSAPVNNGKKDTPEMEESEDEKEGDENQQIYVWPSKADIGMRLRRIIAAFLREQANDARKRKLQEKEQKKENDRKSRAKERESRQAQRARAKQQEASNRWTKKNKSDFLRTVLSFGIDSHPDDPNIRWIRFKEIAGLDKKTDESLNLYYQKFLASCQDSVKRQKQVSSEVSSSATANQEEDDVKKEDESSPGPSGKSSGSLLQAQESMMSRDSSVEPGQENDGAGGHGDHDDHEHAGAELVPFDKARRALKRIEQMKTIREKVMTNPEIDALLGNGRKTSGLPSWWQVPRHDKGLLEGICKHGIGRHDLMINDPELPFFEVKQKIIQEESIQDPDTTGSETVMEKLQWPKDLVIARRIDALCDLVLNPKPQAKKATGGGRKRKVKADASSSTTPTATEPTKKSTKRSRKITKSKVTLTVKKPVESIRPKSPVLDDYNSDDLSSGLDDGYSDSGEDTDTILEEATQRMRKRFKENNHKKSSASSSSPKPTKPKKVQKHARLPETSESPVEDIDDDEEEEKDEPMVPQVTHRPTSSPPTYSSSDSENYDDDDDEDTPMRDSEDF
ncbi:SNF2 family N-terminal domain-containing protein [Phascolomyces articulosus]|uniref:SNF2 family N-terminal domain-containing protein n=1 Tax=Phascolomyces articulosus TaxID=60185 RepID=A0AAD5PJM1_9FUNG|nr:SNF2 family N-terminal domain-containing protein [Phascolomyces articulosus]